MLWSGTSCCSWAGRSDSWRPPSQRAALCPHLVARCCPQSRSDDSTGTDDLWKTGKQRKFVRKSTIQYLLIIVFLTALFRHCIAVTEQNLRRSYPHTPPSIQCFFLSSSTSPSYRAPSSFSTKALNMQNCHI